MLISHAGFASSRSLQLRASSDAVVAMIGELSAFVECVECPREIIDAIRDVVADPGQLFCVLQHNGCAASGADEVVVRFYPSDRLMGIVSAARTWQGNLSIVNKPGHRAFTS